MEEPIFSAEEKPNKKLRLFGFDLEASEEKEGSGVVGKKKFYECKFCHKKFGNSQAFGGHQNAHKKERRTMKKMQMESARKANLELYFKYLGYSCSWVCNPNRFTLVSGSTKDSC